MLDPHWKVAFTGAVAVALLLTLVPATALHPAGSWDIKSPIPFGREGAAGSWIGDDYYVTHGFTWTSGDTTLNHVYDISTDTWAPLPSAMVPRSELVGASVDGLHYAIGGRGCAPSGVCDAVEIYDPATATWSFGPPMPTPRAGLGAAVVDGEIYTFGGRDCASPLCGSPSSAVEILDPATGSWTVGAPMPTARMDVYSVAPVGPLIFVIGGYNPSMGGDLDVVEVYNTITDTWLPPIYPPMPTPRANAIAGVCGDDIYVIGGSSGFGNTAVVEKLSLTPLPGWSPAPPMPSPGSEIAASATTGPSSLTGGTGVIMATGSGIFGASLAQNYAFECPLGVSGTI